MVSRILLIYRFAWICIFIGIALHMHAQDTLKREYRINKTSIAPTIDGDIQDRVWKNAMWSTDFVDITGDAAKRPSLRTRTKMLWDENNLYVAVEMQEPHLWATLTHHDALMYQDHDFEVFIDPVGDQTNYFEIEVNALNATMELFMNKPYRKGGTYDMSWNADGMRTAVGLKGTLNQQHDTDTGWTVEMAIPFSALKKGDRVFQPQLGSKWRINFSRVEWTMEMKVGQYAVKRDARGKKLPEDNWVWSPIGEINMHIPEKWGYIIFK